MTIPIVLTREQVRRVDELALSRYGLAGIVLMENAGRGAAELIEKHFGPGGKALIACGTGNNGGDGLVIARHLHNRGWGIQVLIAGRVETMSPDCATNDRIVQAMALPRFVTTDGELPAGVHSDARTIIVDALLGTGFQGQVRPALAALIGQLNACPRHAMISVDIPSGLDCDTGQPGGIAVRADMTITFVAAKPAFRFESASHWVGKWHVVDIGIPRELLTEL